MQTKIVEPSNSSFENTFSIKATGKAFRILSDGLYTDKILAIVRELSCNAYDAHVAAGTQETPFHVHLPNNTNSHFSIRDFGTGLSHEDVMHLHTTYFESTKTESNDFVGALGLGSKSPFSYVDSYTVNSYFKGTKRLYMAFVGDAGIPSITLLGEEETSEPNGLEIIVPVKSSDFFTFSEKAKKVYRYFKVHPIITGNYISIPQVNSVLEGKDWRLCPVDYYSMAKAVQGNVAYPIDPDSIPNISQEVSAFLRLNIEIHFDIGDLEVAASREALSMDSRTQQNILDKVNSVMSEISSVITEQLNAQPTYWDALTAFNSIKPHIRSNDRFLNSVTYKGETLNPHAVVISLKDHPVTGLYMSQGKKFREIYDLAKNPLKTTTNFKPEERINVWINDVGASGRTRLEYERVDSHRKDFIFNIELPKTVRPRDTVKVKEYVRNASETAKLIEAFEGMPFKYLSELPAPERETSSAPDKFFKFQAGAIGYSYGDKFSVSVDILNNTSRFKAYLKSASTIDGTLWFGLERNKPLVLALSEKKANNDFFYMIEYAVNAGLIKRDTVLTGVRQRNTSKLDQDNEISKFLKREVIAAISHRNLSQKQQNFKILRDVENSFQNVLTMFGALGERFPEAAKLYEDLNLFKSENLLKAEDVALLDLARLLGLQLTDTNIESNSELKDQALDMVQRYPLLSVVASSFNSGVISSKLVLDYINTVDKARSLK